jgi:hypothetical protein
MAGIVRENYDVKVTLLRHDQSNVADFYVKNRIDSDVFSVKRVINESIGVVTGKVFKSVPIGSSVLYLAEVQDITLVHPDSKPLVYRLRKYGW